MFSPSANLNLIKRLRTLRITTDETNASVENEGSPDSDAIHDLNEIFSEHLLSDDDGSDGARLSDVEECSCAGEMYAICETIDDSLFGLYALNEERCQVPTDRMHIVHEYDWLLDGEILDDGLTPKSRRRKSFGEPALDQPLEMMELEDPSLVTASCSPDSLLDETLESGEGIIEFADFREFESGLSDIKDGDGHQAEVVDEEWGGFASADTKQPTVKFDNQVDENQTEQEVPEDDSFIGCVVNTSNEQVDCSQLPEHEISSDYEPSHEIQQLVTDLDAELDITIDECLNTSANTSAEEEDYFNANSLEFSGALQSRLHDDNAQQTNLVQSLETPKSITNRSDHQQSLLMSSVLMESLPMPIPDMETDPLANFTYRVQKSHRDAMLLQSDEVDLNETAILDDEVIERDLADTIHSNYFEGAGGDDDNFDSIVLDEVLNVPWPFYKLDLNEPIVEEEYNELDPEEIDTDNDLNFDSYIFNRLSQLDVAKGEVMANIISRVSLKEKSIDAGNEQILAAELDVAAALMFANSSREYVQRMLAGYPIDSKTTNSERHNVIAGGLRVLDIADSRGRVQYLRDTVERISDICDQEVLFWKEIPDLKSHNSPPLGPEQYQSLINQARNLYNLTLEEEVLCHVTSLHSLRDRIQGLSAVLLECMEDSIADLVRRMLNADDVCNGQYYQEYETLINAWISCCRLRKDNATDTSSLIKTIADGWSGCLLKVLCFEISKAYVYSLIDTLEDDEAPEYIKDELNKLKCSLTNDLDIDRMLNRLLDDRRILTQSFTHQAVRSTEVLSVYCLFLEWHSSIMIETKDETSGLTCLNGDDKSDNLSSMSVDDLSSDASSVIQEDEIQSNAHLPQSFEFQNEASKSRPGLRECMLNSMNRSIRHPLFTFCESKLTQSIEYCISCSTMKLMLDDMYAMELIFSQFVRFGAHFLEDEHDEESDICENIRMSLAELQLSHLRSVHIEAMKSTGALLRHETWYLSPIEFRLASKDEEKKSDGGGNTAEEQNEILQSLQHAVLELYSGVVDSSSVTNSSMNISDRAILHGHGPCRLLTKFLEDSTHPKVDRRIAVEILQFCECDVLRDLASFLMQFVERQPQLSLSIMTQSTANGLLKWTARLISIGMMLPSVTDEALAAVKTLFDLYILTVFRICGRSTINEDALIGLKDVSSSKRNTSMLSLTIEADICSPLHGEDMESLQNYVSQARGRLGGMVNLDKFQASSESDPSSPRRKNGIDQVAIRLEGDIAASVSCIFVALLADVVSQVLCRSMTNDGSVTPAAESFSSFAKVIIAMTPQLVRQSCRLACTHAISSKDVIFQIICVGNVWEDDDIQEYSNSYVEELHERCGEIWAFLSTTSVRLPNALLRYMWDNIVRSAFYTLIEGFSKVTNCSTGGRSLMSMDLNTLSDGLHPDTIKGNLVDTYPSIKSPPASSYRGEGKQYVDAYIKVFFYPDEVLHQWLSENHRQYREEQMMSLVATKRALGNESERFWDLLQESIKALYRNT